MTASIHPYVKQIIDGDMAPPPISSTLGGKIVSLDIGTGSIECEYLGAAAFRNPAGQVQGGMLAAMLDDVTALLLMSTLADGQHCATLNLNVSFVRSAVPGTIVGRASLVRRGARIGNVHGELWQNGKLVATAASTCMVVQ